MPWHTIKPGEWMRQIAYDHGFTDWEAIFNLPENQPLRDAKRDPNQLMPGERVFLPERDRKSADIAAGASHKFVVKRPPQQIYIVLHDEQGKPFKSRPYLVRLPGKVLQGTTDADGAVTIELPPDARDAFLEIDDVQIDLLPGHLDPVDAESGVQARLQNLGFDAGEPGDADKLRAALERFQQVHGIEPSGEPDDATKQKLVEQHGC
jgi:N-acetylmuramoyl-L-alanine amidase